MKVQRKKFQRVTPLITCLLLYKTAFAGVPVTPASNQAALLTSTDTNLAANKKLVYDFWRIVLVGRHLEQASNFMRED